MSDTNLPDRVFSSSIYLIQKLSTSPPFPCGSGQGFLSTNHGMIIQLTWLRSCLYVSTYVCMCYNNPDKRSDFQISIKDLWSNNLRFSYGTFEVYTYSPRIPDSPGCEVFIMCSVVSLLHGLIYFQQNVIAIQKIALRLLGNGSFIFKQDSILISVLLYEFQRLRILDIFGFFKNNSQI